MVNKLNLVDLYRTLHSIIITYKFQMYKERLQISDHPLGHKEIQLI